MLRPTLASELQKHYSAVMDAVDLNLLSALVVLLIEGSVTGAARRLGLSSSAMSRTLERLRKATGDPLLVRAGADWYQSLMPRLCETVYTISLEAKSILRPSLAKLDLAATQPDVHDPCWGMVYGDAFNGRHSRNN